MWWRYDVPIDITCHFLKLGKHKSTSEVFIVFSTSGCCKIKGSGMWLRKKDPLP